MPFDILEPGASQLGGHNALAEKKESFAIPIENRSVALLFAARVEHEARQSSAHCDDCSLLPNYRCTFVVLALTILES